MSAAANSLDDAIPRERVERLWAAMQQAARQRSDSSLLMMLDLLGSEQDVARALLSLVDDLPVTDEVWSTDPRIARARETLNVPVDGRRSHAHLWAGAFAHETTSR